MITLSAEDIMLENVIVGNPNDLVAACKLKMFRSNIGALPIVDGKKLVGIITHRDVLWAGNEVVTLKIKDLMTKELVTAERDTSVIEISKIMSETGLQRIPVVEDGNLIGLVTQSCIIKAVANMFKP